MQSFNVKIEKFSDFNGLEVYCVGKYLPQEIKSLYSSLDVDFIKKLNGSFTIAIVDNYKKKVILCRDKLGTLSLYFSFKNNIFYFSTSFFSLEKDVKAKNLNIDYLCEVYGGCFSDMESTYYSEISRVKPCHFLEFNFSEIKLKKYFDIASYIKGNEQLKFDLNDILKGRVKEIASPGTEVGLFLSGGLDSCLLASLFSDHNIICLTLSFQNLFEQESRNIEFLKTFLNFQFKSKLHSENSDIFLYNYKDLNYIYYTPSLAFFVPLFEEVQNNKLKKVMTGLGGDDVFSINENHLSYLIKNGNLRLLLKNMKGYLFDGIALHKICISLLNSFVPGMIFRLFKRIRYFFQLKKLGISTSHSLRISRKQVNDDLKRRAYKNPIHQSLVYRFFISGAYVFGMENEQELAQQFGAIMDYPFLNEDVIFHALNLSVENFRLDRMDKVVLREVARKYVNDEIALNRSQQEYGAISDKIVARQMHEMFGQLQSGNQIQKIPIQLARQFKDMRHFLNTYNILKMGKHHEKK